MSVMNALVASHDVMIPIKIDNFAFDGVREILEQVEAVREFNEEIRVAGGFVTMYQRNNVNAQGVEHLQGADSLTMFRTVIRKTVKGAKHRGTSTPRSGSAGPKPVTR